MFEYKSRCQDEAIADLIGFEFIDGGIDLGEGKNLDFRMDTVAGGKGEHFVHEGAICVIAADDAALGGDEMGKIEVEAARRTADKAEGAVGFEKS